MPNAELHRTGCVGRATCPNRAIDGSMQFGDSPEFTAIVSHMGFGVDPRQKRFRDGCKDRIGAGPRQRSLKPKIVQAKNR